MAETLLFPSMSPVTEMYNTTHEWFNSNASNNDIGTDGISNVTVPSVAQEDKLEGLLSDATAHTIQTVVEVGILPELVLAGVTMNIMNMAVFLHQGLSDRINLCLFSLALSDTGYILFLLITRLHSIFRLFDPLLGRYWQLRCLGLIGIYAGFMTTSNCLTLLISLERCVLVISPLKARTMLPTRYMAVIIVVIFATCLSCLGIFGIKFDVITVLDPVTNATSYKPVFNQFYLDNRDPIEFLFQTFNAVIPTIAFIGVVIATSAIAVRMRAVAAWRQKSTSTSTSDRREASVTRMLFVVCVMYTICSIPSVVRPLVTLLVYEFQPGMRYENTMFTTVSLMHLIAAINSSFNFVIYYVMSTRFRDTFRELFKRAKAEKGIVDTATKTTNSTL